MWLACFAGTRGKRGIEDNDVLPLNSRRQLNPSAPMGHDARGVWVELREMFDSAVDSAAGALAALNKGDYFNT